LASWLAMAQAQAEGTKDAQRAGIAHAKANDPIAYRGRKPTFSREQFSTVLNLAGQGTKNTSQIQSRSDWRGWPWQGSGKTLQKQSSNCALGVCELGASHWRTKATTPAPCKPISATRTFNTPSDTPSYRRPGSRISGTSEVLADLGHYKQVATCDGLKRTSSARCGAGREEHIRWRMKVCHDHSL